MLAILGAAAWCATAQVIDLSTISWQLSNSNQSITVPGKVPGTVHTDLLAAKVITDPYYGTNDADLRWVSASSWTYVGVFDAPHHGDPHTLVAEGLDTRVDISVNGKLLVEADNMFRRWEAAVPAGVLERESNQIKLFFHSPVGYAEEQWAGYKMPSPLGIPPDCPPESVTNGACHRNFVRKSQSSFGWSNAPALPSCGVLGSLRLVEASVPLSVSLTARPGGGSEYLVGIKATKSPEATLTVSIQDAEGKQVASYDGVSPSPIITLPEGNLWYPRGHGAQYLYTATCTVGAQVVVKKFGLRQVELRQQPSEDGRGTDFAFWVNGVPVFLKGASVVPLDAFVPRADADNNKVGRLVGAMVDANFNAVRVWGGGSFLPEAFYAAADEAGLLVWQDLMLARAAYPSNPEFLESVAAEAGDQAGRLNHHPSIVVWALNDEAEVALAQDWFGNTSTQPAYAQDYRKLYWDTVLGVVEAAAGGRPVLPSTPSSGRETASDPLQKDCNADASGDVHAFSPPGDCWDPSTYRNARFVTEFGRASWSSLSSLRSVTAAEDLRWGSAWFDQRNHCDPKSCGNAALKAQVERHYRWPGNTTNQIYLTQVAQAYCVKLEAEHHRRNRYREGGPHTMGALYWHANDVWQTASGSSLEYNLQWKMLHHFARLFFSDFFLSASLDDGRYDVVAINDRPVPLEGMARISVYQWNGQATTTNTPFDINPYSSIPLASGYVVELARQAGCQNPADCVMVYTLESEGRALYESFLLLDSPNRAAALPNPDLRVADVQRVSAHEFDLTVKGVRAAAFVWLSLPVPPGTSLPVQFSKNGFFYAPDRECVVRVTTPHRGSREELLSHVTINSLSSV